MTESYPSSPEGTKRTSGACRGFNGHSLKEQQIIVDQSLDQLSKMMEEMANAPKEEYGKRQPGETCAYERKHK